MDSIKSHKSSDNDSATFLKNEVINVEHAILTEFYTNYSDTYNSNYAYLDFLNMYFENESTFVYYMEKCAKEDIFKILDVIDEVYCQSVLNQQSDVKKIIENNIRIPENEDIKGSIYSFKNLVEKLKKKIYLEQSKYDKNTFRQLNIYLKDAHKKSIKSYKHLWIKADENKLEKVEKIFFNEIVCRYPRYDREDYYRVLTNKINTISLDVDVLEIADIIFGKKSNNYDKSDKEKRFFKKIKKSFSIYHGLNESSQSIKFYFNDSWKGIVIKMRKKLLGESVQ